MEDLKKPHPRKCDKRIGLMLIAVFNHTSTEHAWFQRALAVRKYQITTSLRTEPRTPAHKLGVQFGGPAWQYVPQLGKWYLHLFDVTQADLESGEPGGAGRNGRHPPFLEGEGNQGFRALMWSI